MRDESKDAPDFPGTQVAEALTPELLAQLEADWERPRPTAAPRRAAMLTVALLLPLVANEWPQHNLPGPWQGFLALPPGGVPAPLPPIWQALCQALAQLCGTEAIFAARAVAVLSVVLLASAVAAIASLLYCIARQRIPARIVDMQPPDAMSARRPVREFLSPRWPALREALPGVLAGGGVYLGYHAQMAWFGAGPEALTAALATWGAYFFLRHYDRPTVDLGMILAAVLIGLASVQQPYFLVLAAACLAWAMGCAPDDKRLLRRAGAQAIVFTFTLAMPALILIQNGTAPRALLDHLLRLPYPDFSFAPQMHELQEGEATTLIYMGPLALLILVGIWRKRLLRTDASFLLCAGLLLGPGMLLIANPPRATLVPIDTNSPALVGLGLLLAASMPLGLTLFTRVRNQYLRRGTTLAVLLVLVFTNGFLRAPALLNSPDTDPYEMVAELMGNFTREASAQGIVQLAPCQPGAIVVVGRLDLASTLWLQQAAAGYDPTLRIVPASWLLEPEGRAAAQRILGEKTPLRADFPDAEATARWGRELPFESARLSEAGAKGFNDGLLPFALWDLAATEVPQGPVYFLGVDAPWVLARCTPAGYRLVYPGYGIDDFANDYFSGRSSRYAYEHPLGFQMSFQAKNAWHKSQHVRGKTVGTYNAKYYAWAFPNTPEAPELHAAFLRAFTNAGNADGVITPLIAPDLNLLWQHSRAAMLRIIYNQLNEPASPNPEVLYQLAAVHAVLGKWDECTDALRRWQQTLGPAAPTPQLDTDTRFDLYRRWLALHPDGMARKPPSLPAPGDTPNPEGTKSPKKQLLGIKSR